MIVEWDDFIKVLGKNDHSTEFISFCRKIGENPYVSSDPDEYNDPVGKTKYYKFYQSGAEVGFRKELLSHIHFYFYKEDGYSPFRGGFIPGIRGGMDKSTVTSLLGKPSLSGEGKVDILLGYINGWSKYEKENYSIHLQFNENSQLCRATLMR